MSPALIIELYQNRGIKFFLFPSYILLFSVEILTIFLRKGKGNSKCGESVLTFCVNTALVKRNNLFGNGQT